MLIPSIFADRQTTTYLSKRTVQIHKFPSQFDSVPRLFLLRDLNVRWALTERFPTPCTLAEFPQVGAPEIYAKLQLPFVKSRFLGVYHLGVVDIPTLNKIFIFLCLQTCANNKIKFRVTFKYNWNGRPQYSPNFLPHCHAKVQYGWTSSDHRFIYLLILYNFLLVTQ